MNKPKIQATNECVAEKTHGASAKPLAPPAQITLLYESRDGKLCLFQDAEGHLTAVRSSQLA